MNYLLAQSASGSVTVASPASDEVRSTDFSLLDWNGWGFEVRIGLLWLVVGLFIFVAVWWVLPLLRRKWLRGYRTRAIKLSFKGMEWEICPDSETRRVAHQAWVEIKSRKVGLPFEEGADVIVEVYSSWYQLFGVLRELAKTIPADRIHDCEDTRNLVALLMKALNEGLRPHLTKWQAQFRRWYDAHASRDENRDKTPQELQQAYPHYSELVAELRTVSQEFVQFADSLELIVKGGR
jgi:hypothetical protein